MPTFTTGLRFHARPRGHPRREQRARPSGAEIDNPPHHPAGDFALEAGRVANDGDQRYTFSGIGIYRPVLFAEVAAGTKRQLSSVLRPQIDAGRVTGEHYAGNWADLGTPSGSQRSIVGCAYNFRMEASIFGARRNRLASAMQRGVAIVPTAPERTRNRDAHIRTGSTVTSTTSPDSASLRRCLS